MISLCISEILDAPKEFQSHFRNLVQFKTSVGSEIFRVFWQCLILSSCPAGIRKIIRLLSMDLNIYFRSNYKKNEITYKYAFKKQIYNFLEPSKPQVFGHLTTMREEELYFFLIWNHKIKLLPSLIATCILSFKKFKFLCQQRIIERKNMAVTI